MLNPYLSENSHIPDEILQLIFSFLDATDLVHASKASLFFNRNAQAPALYRGLIADYFPYLLLTKASTIRFLPHQVFTQEYYIWRHVAQGLNIDVKMLLNAFRGRSSAEQKANLSEEDKGVVELIEAAGQYLRAVVKPPVASDNHALIALLKRLQPSSFPGPITPLCTMRFGKMANLVNTLASFSEIRVLSSEQLLKLFKEHLVAETPERRSFFDKIKECSVEELIDLKKTFEDLFIMLEDIADLTEAQQKLLTKITPLQEDIDHFKRFCLEYYGDDFNAALPSPIYTNQGHVTTGAQFVAYLGNNALGQFATEIMTRIDREIARKSVTTQPAITPGLAQYRASATTPENTATASLPKEHKPFL